MSNCSRKHRKNLSNNRSRKQLYFKGGTNEIEIENEIENENENALLITQDEDESNIHEELRKRKYHEIHEQLQKYRERQISNFNKKQNKYTEQSINVNFIIDHIKDIIKKISEDNKNKCIDKIYEFYEDKLVEILSSKLKLDREIIKELLIQEYNATKFNKRDYIINNNFLFFIIFWYDDIFDSCKENLSSIEQEWCDNWFDEMFERSKIEDIINDKKNDIKSPLPNIDGNYNVLIITENEKYNITFYGKECITKFPISGNTYDLSGYYNRKEIIHILNEVTRDESKDDVISEPVVKPELNQELKKFELQISSFKWVNALPDPKVIIGLYEKVYGKDNFPFLIYKVLSLLAENKTLSPIDKQTYLFRILTEDNIERLNSDEEVKKIKEILKNSIKYGNVQKGVVQSGGSVLNNVVLTTLLGLMLLHNVVSEQFSPYGPYESGYIFGDTIGSNHNITGYATGNIDLQSSVNSSPSVPSSNMAWIAGIVTTVVGSAGAYMFHNRTQPKNVEDSEMNKKIEELLKGLECNKSFCSQRKNMKENRKKTQEKH